MAGSQAILFDLGDTLIQFGRVDRAALFRQAAVRTYRMWASRQRRMPDFRRYYLHQWFAIHWGLMKTTLRRREVDTMRMLRRACRKLWLTAPDPFFDELAWTWYQPLAEVARLEPGTHATLRRLRDGGYRLGIVSNTFVPGFVLDRHLQQLGLLPFFPHRIYSCDVGYRKPDRRIFQRALQVVGTAPEQTIFVGDMLGADIKGAHRVGMLPIWKRPAHRRHLTTPMSGAQVDRLSELPDLIAQLTADRVPCRWLAPNV